MPKKIFDVRKYALNDQRYFARLSGDINPMHINPVVARREIFGDTVVHGIHALLHALDAYMAKLRLRGLRSVTLEKLSALFPNPIYTNQEIRTYLVKEQGNTAKIEVQNSGLPLIEIELRWAKRADSASNNLSLDLHKSHKPVVRKPTFKELSGCQGKLNLYIDSKRARDEFPALSKLSSLYTTELLALSRLVGTECPGLQSILSSLDIEFHPIIKRRPCLTYKVVKTDPRFSRVKIAVTSTSMSGMIDAFYRPLLPKQASISYVKRKVRRTEFSKQRALIIGGSRGLGEATAKIVAAGNGYPIITYHRGLQDARSVASEIHRAGKACEILNCNIFNPGKAISNLAKSGCTLTHLYYFASPKIFVKKQSAYDKKLFKSFAGFYVDGFSKTYKACRSFWPGKLSIFYPSSTALDEKVKTLLEYSDAKAAGEALCRRMERSDSKVSILVKRLPRIATDQTTTIMPYPAANALDVMLKIVRELPN